ncbi:MAG: hypothetical protein VW455_09280 [Nitrospinota bacterium]
MRKKKRQSIEEAWRATFSTSERTKKQADISWIVWLFENPRSPLALHGAASLYTHDHIHLLLDRCIDKEDEAFVIGFSMGNDTKTNWLDVWLFKFVSRFLYPEDYRFDSRHLKIYDMGFQFGRTRKFKNITSIDFSKLDLKMDLSRVRKIFDIDENELEEFDKEIAVVTFGIGKEKQPPLSPLSGGI